MKTLRTKLMMTAGAALGGLILYRLSIQLGEMVDMIQERHPAIGVGGWLLFGLWGASAVAVGGLSDRFWKDRKLFLPGDVPMAIMILYMAVSALIYQIQTGW